MTNFSRSATTLALLALGVLAGCGSVNTAADETPGGIASASAQQISEIPPSQSQILNEKNFAYLMANPSTEQIDLERLQTEAQQIPATLAEHRSPDPSRAAALNEQCGIYEQAAIGMISTPDTLSWNIETGSRRSIIIGQSGKDQISGYSQVLTATSVPDATNLLNQFKSKSLSCSNALKAFYPDIADSFHFSSPSVDAASGVVTLNGTYDGHDFSIAFAQRDKYLISTWFKTTANQSSAILSSATESIQAVALKTADSL